MPYKPEITDDMEDHPEDGYYIDKRWPGSKVEYDPKKFYSVAHCKGSGIGKDFTVIDKLHCVIHGTGNVGVFIDAMIKESPFDFNNEWIVSRLFSKAVADGLLVFKNAAIQKKYLDLNTAFMTHSKKTDQIRRSLDAKYTRKGQHPQYLINWRKDRKMWFPVYPEEEKGYKDCRK